MRVPARIALVIVVLLAGATVLPRSAGRVLTPEALAQIPLPSPTIPDILPSPTVSETPTPPDPGDGDGGDGGKDGSDGGGGGGGGGGGDPVELPGGNNTGDGGGARQGDGGARGGGKRGGRSTAPVANFYRVPGSYNTDALLSVAARLRSLGWSKQRVLSGVFAPFIIGGKASWVDTWGAPRFGPGPIVRTHEGQDVFCEYGDPVLASESGRIEFAEGGLGGKVARLYRSDGSYWYYAHLSDWNTKEFASNSTVEQGDVIGFCGNSGNALTTPPHVHFGWYKSSGAAKNPMRTLVKWLREAEANAAGLAGRAEGKRQKQIAALTAARRFGDAFGPDLSEFRVSGESLWASGSSPATGALGLAESALQSALASAAVESGTVAQPLAGVDGVDGFGTGAAVMDPAAQLAVFMGESEQEGAIATGEQAD
jgi:murein DD-endopeptidase MepM/ murein hydrolase activator NlpD